MSIEISSSSDIVTLGQLIDVLEEYPEDAEVIFSGEDADGLYPYGFDSYKGIYSDLALSYFKKPMFELLKGFLESCDNALSWEMSGYGGGQYLVDRGTFVWVSNNDGRVFAISSVNYDVEKNTVFLNLYNAEDTVLL